MDYLQYQVPMEEKTQTVQEGRMLRGMVGDRRPAPGCHCDSKENFNEKMLKDGGSGSTF